MRTNCPGGDKASEHLRGWFIPLASASRKSPLSINIKFGGPLCMAMGTKHFSEQAFFSYKFQGFT
jgi:hypothetical protein